MNDENLEKLRLRRSEAAAARTRARLRAAHGERLIEALQMVTAGVTLQDFDASGTTALFPVHWPECLEDANGLVAAYISNERASKIAQCLAAKVRCQGLIGIYRNDYLGYCFSSSVSMEGMLGASDKLNEAVVFYPDSNDGAIIFDCYASNPGEAYSVLVQGGNLVELTASCFEAPHR